MSQPLPGRVFPHLEASLGPQGITRFFPNQKFHNFVFTPRTTSISSTVHSAIFILPSNVGRTDYPGLQGVLPSTILICCSPFPQPAIPSALTPMLLPDSQSSTCAALSSQPMWATFSHLPDGEPFPWTAQVETRLAQTFLQRNWMSWSDLVSIGHWRREIESHSGRTASLTEKQLNVEFLRNSKYIF